MKQIVYIFIFTLLLTVPCLSEEQSVETMISSRNFQDFKFKEHQAPSPDHLAIIWFILSNTGEHHIHQMRGEKDNEVFTRQSDDHSGYMEAVYDGNGKLVTNSYNKGSYNYYYYKNYPIMHFAYDTLPWLEFGNDRNDPTSFQERLFHYTLDLNYGIQAYLFAANNNDMMQIDWNALSNNKRLVFQFFNYLIFNTKYKIELNKQNLEKLKVDSDFYWNYFYQLQDLLNVKQ